MYNFRYDSWDDVRFPGYQMSMSRLYDKSMSFYMSHALVPSEKDTDIQVINLLFGYMEYYFAGIMKLRYVGKSNFQNVLTQMKDIRLIQLMEPKLRSRVNGLTYNHVITMNPTPGNYTGMNQENTLQLSLFHEMGHIITASNKEDIESFMESVFSSKSFQQKYPTFVCSYEDFGKGFDLLDEVVVQNVAEAVLFDRLGIKRPEPKMFKNKTLYPKGDFLSNFVEYREFQEVAYRFAKCLSFLECQKKESMDDVLNRLSRSMFSRDFGYQLYREFLENPEKGEELVQMLICMGKMKEAKYTSFGLGSNGCRSLDVSFYFELFDHLAKKNETVQDSQVYQKVQS